MSASDFTGGASDEVTLKLNGKDVLIAESYDTRQSYFEQPASFSITVGSGDSAKSFLEKYGPNSDFELRVGDALQFKGVTDAIEANGNGSATTITIRGRDGMAPLLENRLVCDQSFSEATYHDLLNSVLIQVLGADAQFAIRFDNASVSDNRKRQANVNVVSADIPPDLAALFTDLPQKPQIQGKAGEPVYQFLKKEFDRTGLFAYCAGDGTYILSAPNSNQTPTYRISRQRGATRNLVNVTDHRFRYDTTGRSTTYTVLGRGGGAPVASGANVPPDDLASLNLAVGARVGIRGEYVDPEMRELGIKTQWVHKDKHATSSKAAAYLARKKAAQCARHGFELEYTVSGHTVPSIASGRAVWTVDTIVDLQDDELGLHGPYWIESVSRHRSMGSGTTSKIRLVPLAYNIYGGGSDD